MKRKVVIIILSFFAMFLLSSCTKTKVDKVLMDFKNRFDISLPEEYEILFFKSETSIDSVTT